MTSNHWNTSHISECSSDVSVLITSPANGVTLAPGTFEVSVAFSISNFELGVDGYATLAFQSMDAEGTMIENEMLNNPTSPLTLTVACGLTYQVSIVLYNNDMRSFSI